MGTSNGNRGAKKPRLPKCILLVEDHKVLASILAAFLRQEGYKVQWARDGRQARRLLATKTLHLVITDSALPDRSGWEVASDAKKQGLPVILSSGWPVRMLPGQLAAHGVNYLCPKPCRPGQLLSFVRRALRQSQPRPCCSTPVPKSQYQSHR